MRKILIIMTATLFISGCSYFHLYRPDVQQGNYLNITKVNKLRTGMTRFEVEHIMGKTVLDDTFTGNQMAYVYTSQISHHKMTQKRIVLTMKKGKVIRIQKDLPINKKP